MPRRGVLRGVVVLVAGGYASSSSLAGAQQIEWRVAGVEHAALPSIGQSLALLDDLDGDGIAEVATGGDPGAPLRLLSGATLRELWSLDVGADPIDALAWADDLDGDGIGELLLGHASVGPGVVRLRSGRDGTLLRERVGATDGERLGAALAPLGDLDGDGRRDFAIGAPLRQRDGETRGALLLWSGRGDLIATLEGGTGETHVGLRVAAVGDLDHDGAIDVAALGATQDPLQPTYARPFVRLWSSATRQRLGDHGFEDAVVELDLFDATLAAVGDVDGDRLGDWAVAAPWLRAAEAEVRSGADGAVLWRYAPPLGYSGSAIASLAPAGDVDGDGLGDLALGGGFDVGDWFAHAQVRLFAGGRFVELAVLAAPGLPSPGSSFATALLLGGDLDGDGRGDLLIAEPDHAPWHEPIGALHAASTPSLALLATASGDPVGRRERVGDAASLIGDVDGDGECDLLVAGMGRDRSELGKAALRSGSSGATLQRLRSSWGRDEFGLAATALPDLDGDGIGDVAVTDGDSAMAGDGWLVVAYSTASGAPLWTLADARTGANEFGAALAAAIDPGDGAIRLAVGAPGGRGRVALHATTDRAQLWSVTGGQLGAEFGAALAFVGDQDGDGRADLAIGAPLHDDAAVGVDCGRILLVSGVDGRLLAERLGAAAGERYGAALAAVADLDGDGREELLVGAPASGSATPGRAELLRGATLEWLTSFAGDRAGDRFGAEVATLADANRDGAAELAIGAPGADRVTIWSGGNAALLARFFGANGARFGAHLSAAPPWIAVPGGASVRRRLAIGAPDDEAQLGSVTLVGLPALSLQFEPERGRADELVTVALRGGPPGAPAGLYLVAVDGASVGIFAAFVTLDGEGAFVESVAVPAGLAGREFRFRGYAIGFDGALAVSSDATFTVE